MILEDHLWLDPETWGEVQSGLDWLLSLHAKRCGPILEMAACILRRMQAVDPVLSQVCAWTCPECVHPCCQRATVRYDLRDLLFLHCIHWAVPVGHPSPDAGDCCYLGPEGCMMPRFVRPFLCTWYLCPSQMDILRQAGNGPLAQLPQRLQEIQDLRKDLEEAFVQMVVSPPGAVPRAGMYHPFGV